MMATPNSADDGDWRAVNQIWAERAKYMLDTGKFSDVKINVRNSHKEKTFAAHSLILRCASPVFEAMLEGKFKESSNVIEFEHCPDAFQALMTFIYLDHVDIQSSTVAWDLYGIAHMYDVKRLDVLCTSYIVANINAQTAWLALVRSRIYNLKQIENLSHNFIVTNTTDVVSSADFLDLEESTISWLLDETTLNIPEAMLFNSVELWINAEMIRKGGTEEVKKALIQRLIPKIHFLEMTYPEILDGPSKSNCLTMEQKLWIFTHLQNSDPQDQSNLAAGLSVFPQIRNSCKTLNNDNYSPYSAEFKPHSFALLSLCISIRLQNDYLAFNFKTTSKDCCLISVVPPKSWLPTRPTDIMYFTSRLWIGVDSLGKLRLQACDSLRTHCEIISDECVNDDKLHSVSFKFCQSDMVMDLDDIRTTLKHNFGSDPIGPIRIGRNDNDNGFSGCISSIFISSLNRKVNFRSDPEHTLNVKACNCEIE